jgi:hypothetical protein
MRPLHRQFNRQSADGIFQMRDLGTSVPGLAGTDHVVQRFHRLLNWDVNGESVTSERIAGIVDSCVPRHCSIASVPISVH